MIEFSTVIKNHDGQLLNQLLADLGVEKGWLASKLGRHGNTVTNLTKRETISSEILINIGKILRYDMRARFEKLNKIPEASVLHYFNSDPDQLLTRVEEIEVKYGKDLQLKANLEVELEQLKTHVSVLNNLISAKNHIIEMQERRLQDQENRLRELDKK